MPKNKQQKKTRQQRQKDRKREIAQKKHERKSKKKKNEKKKPRYSQQELTMILVKSCVDLNVESLSRIKGQLCKISIKQAIMTDCFASIWKQCSAFPQRCSSENLSKKIKLIKVLIEELHLNKNVTENYLTNHEEMENLCTKCMCPMIEFCKKYLDESHDYLNALKSLALYNLRLMLSSFEMSIGSKITYNEADIIHSSWSETIKPSLESWWTLSNVQTYVSIIEWCMSQGTLLDDVLLNFSDFKMQILESEFHEHRDKQLKNLVWTKRKHKFVHVRELTGQLLAWDLHATQLKTELKKIDFDEMSVDNGILNILLCSVGQSISDRKFLSQPSVHFQNAIDILFDRDLEYVHMQIAKMFDRGRAKWMKTEQGTKVYQSYVNEVNKCIDAHYPVIGEIITSFLIGTRFD